MHHPRFAPLQAAFDALVESRELGAGFAVYHRGELVAELYGGFADRGRTRPFAADTLVPVFSVTKLLAALLMARLADGGRLSYAAPVADAWPAFASAGKAEVTNEMMLSHQAGLSGLPQEMDPADWFDWDLICGRLAAMAPLWPPGTASGYHPVTFGYLAGEVFRRIDGRTMGSALREDLAEPFGLDLHIGLRPEDDARVAELERPKQLPRFGMMNPALKAAFLTKWASPGGRGAAAWRRAEIPSANGHATARSLAALLSRTLDPEGGVLSPAGLEALTRSRIRGPDLVLPFDISWGAGVMRNEGIEIYGPSDRAFGHSGWGGACAAADPDQGLAFAYVMNRQSSELLGDPRPRLLIETLYACLG